MNQVISLPGHIFAESPKHRLYNRTGATTVLGSIGVIDTAQADAASTTLWSGMNNVVAVADGQTDRGGRVYAAAQGAVADDGQCLWSVQQPNTICQALVDGTTDITKGDLLVPVEGGDHMVKATRTALADANGDASASIIAALREEPIAEALESFTTNGEGVIWIRWLPTGLVRSAD